MAASHIDGDPAEAGHRSWIGVAVLNGLVWVSAVEHLRQEGIDPHEAAREAAVVRLRPILMTTLVLPAIYPWFADYAKPENP